MNRPLFLAAAAMTLLYSNASERYYTFNYDGDETHFYGTGRKETCDVAVCMNEPGLVGFSIKGISVAIPGNPASYESASAFITKELKIDLVNGLRVNVPDICSAEAVIADGRLTATFAEPYTITSDTVYVGYSFTIKELNDESKSPLAVVPGNDPDGLWFHSNRTALKWVNYVDKVPGGIQSDMNIILEGDFQAASATPQLPSHTVFLTGENASYGFTVFNYGSEEISSVECEWTVGENKGSFAYNFNKPVSSMLGASAEAYVSLPAVDIQGVYPVCIDIKRVNGTNNSTQMSADESKIIYSDVLPVHLPLVEEYTGLWCGNCPRGYAALEWMKEKYGSQFVAASWHNGDPMTVTVSYPSSFGGFPASWIDRMVSMDPSAIPSRWEALRDTYTDIAMSCSIDFSSDSHSTLTAVTDVLPIIDSESPLSVGYILVADGLSDPLWLQANYYSGGVSSELPGEWAEFFANAPSKVMGLIYNDVVVNANYALGVPNSLPSSIKAFSTYRHEITFPLEGITNDSGNPIAIDPEKVRVLAFVIDSNGNVLNSCSSAYPGQSDPELGSERIESESSIVSTEWYDLRGNRVSVPSGSVFIRVDIMSDGSCRANKIALTRN